MITTSDIQRLLEVHKCRLIPLLEEIRKTKEVLDENKNTDSSTNSLYRFVSLFRHGSKKD